MSDDNEHVGSENKSGPVASETPVRQSFKPHAAIVVVAIVIMIGSIVIAVMTARKDGLDSRAIGEIVGSAFGAVLWPFLVGWGAYRGFRRSNKAGNIAILVMLGLGLLSFGGGVLRRQHQEKLMREASAVAAQSSEAAANGDTDKAVALSQQAASKLEESAKAAPENQRVVAEYGASIGRQLAEIMGAYAKSLGEFSKAGGESCDGIVDEASFESRIKLLDDAMAKHDKVLEHLKSLDEGMPKALAERGVPAAQAEAFIREFRNSGKIEKAVRIQQIEHDMLNIMGARLEILQGNAGRWSCKDGTVTASAEFPDEDLKRYNDLQGKLAELGEEQTALQAEAKKKK